MADPKKHAVILFDGVCNFCNRSVQFIIKRDRSGYFRFASQQSSAGSALLGAFPEALGTDSIVLIEREKAYTESTAVLRIARRLDGLWKAAYLAIVIPRPLRDLFYRWFARRRYRWFGKQSSCMMPTPDMRERFLSTD